MRDAAIAVATKEDWGQGAISHATTWVERLDRRMRRWILVRWQLLNNTM